MVLLQRLNKKIIMGQVQKIIGKMTSMQVKVLQVTIGAMNGMVRKL